MTYIDPLTPEPDNSWAQKFTTQQLINSHNHLISVGMANSRAVRLMRNEINLRARIARKLRALGVALDNFDPNELRDWHGRWTTEDYASDSKPSSPAQAGTADSKANIGDQNPQEKPPQAELRPFTTSQMIAAKLRDLEHKLFPGTQTGEFQPSNPARYLEGFKEIGRLLDKAGEIARDDIASQMFLYTGDWQDAAKQWGVTSDQLKRLGFKDVEEDSGTTGDKPFEQGMQMLPPAEQAVSRAAEGIVKSTPRLAVAEVDPFAGAAAFGITSQGFDPKQAALALALPFVGKYSGEIAGVIAQRFGVDSVTALNALKAISGMGTSIAALIAEQEHEISKLPPEQRKEARINMWANIAGMTILGAKGVKLEPEPGKIPLHSPDAHNPSTSSGLLRDTLKVEQTSASESTVPEVPRQTRPVGRLRAAGLKDAHHIIQDATVRHIPGYDSQAAPGLRLPGPSTMRGGPHYEATRVQRQRGGGTYAAERRIGYKALRRAGLSEPEARQAISEADAYFSSLGVNNATRTKVPRNRR